MKCPFVSRVVRKITSRVDAQGKVIGDDVVETNETAECLRDECMVYDKSNASCSLFVSNLRAGQLLAELKKSSTEMGKALFERTETLGVIYSTNFQTLQDAVLSKLDLIRKSNEIMAMGLDRTSGSLAEIIESIGKLNIPLSANAESGKTLEKLIGVMDNGLRNGLASLSTDLKGVLITVHNESKQSLAQLGEALKKDLTPMVEDLKSVRAASEIFVQFTNNALGGIGDISKSVDLLDVHVNNAFKELGTRVESDIKFQGEVAGQETQKALKVSEHLVELSSSTVNSLSEVLNKIGTVGEQLSGRLGNLDEHTAAVLKETASGLGDYLRHELQPVAHELVAGRAASEAALQSLNMVINSLTDVFKGVTTLDETATKGLGTVAVGLEAVAGQVGNLGGKLDGMEKNMVVVGAQQQAAFDGFAQSVKDMAAALDKSYQSIVQYAGQQTEMSSSVVIHFKALEDSLRAMSEEGDTPLRDIAHELEKLQTMLHDRLEIYKVGLEGLLALEKKGFDRNAEAIDALRAEYGQTVVALTDAARSIHETETELKSFTGKTADALNDNITRVTSELSIFQTELARYIKENIGRFTEIVEQQKSIAEGSRTAFESMNTVFKKQEEQLKAQERTSVLQQAQVRNDRATVMFHRGNYDAALLEIDEALKIEESAEYHNNRGLILSEMGRPDDSRKAFQKAIEMAPSMSEPYNNLGLLYLKIKDYDSAVATFGEATKRNINYAAAFTNLGHAFAANESFDEAIKAWEKALTIDPTNHDAREALKLYKEGRVDGYTAET